MAVRPPLPSPQSLRRRRDRRTQRILASRAVANALVSVAGLVGQTVCNPSGAEVGRLLDVVARWDNAPYPLITGLVVKVGRRLAFVNVAQIDELGQHGVRLRSAKLDLADFERRPGEVILNGDVVDHQLVDFDGVRVVRAADLYLAKVGGRIRLVGVDVGFQTLLRRLLPARWRARPTPEKVIDWAAVQPFGGPGNPLRLRQGSHSLQRLRPGELADLLEELGRDERQELLAALEPGAAADALEEMDPEELGVLLHESGTERAAELLSEMEPDEAVDALRSLDEEEQTELLEAMPEETAEELAGLLSFPERSAGGVMTTNLVLVGEQETVADVRRRLQAEVEHAADIDAVIVIDASGQVVDDVTTFELFVGEPHQTMAELCRPPWPVAISPDAGLEEVVQRFIEARGTSVLVVDADERPLGRILADDLIDALVPDRGRLRFPRVFA